MSLDMCARHFELDAEKWAAICRRSAVFYNRTAHLRFDPAERSAISDRYAQAAADFDAGRPVRDPTLPSIALAVSLVQPARAKSALRAPGIASGKDGPAQRPDGADRARYRRPGRETE